MTNELRWILLGLGVLFCIGLWWWESRRGRQATDAHTDLRAPDPYASLNAIAREAMPERDSRPREFARQREAGVPSSPDSQARGTPPPARDELRMPDHELADEKLRIQDEPEIPPRSRFAPAEPEAMADRAEDPPGFAADGRIEPAVGDFGLETPTIPVETTEAAAPSAVTPSAVSPSIVSDEKIVTIRVAAPPLERFEGSALVHALGEAGLEHGRFSIFHRLGAGGETLFSVASLVEPGTFDLRAVEGKRYPGVSFFTVLRRPEDALEILDEMLNTAREFAHEMRGSLQDDRGANLGLQRLSTLRDEVVAWQKAASRSRPS